MLHVMRIVQKVSQIMFAHKICSHVHGTKYPVISTSYKVSGTKYLVAHEKYQIK